MTDNSISNTCYITADIYVHKYLHKTINRCVFINHAHSTCNSNISQAINAKRLNVSGSNSYKEAVLSCVESILSRYMTRFIIGSRIDGIRAFGHL